MPAVQIITEQALDALRAEVGKQIQEYRFRHTLGVEKEITRLGELYLPRDILRLRAAALLHDITKEKTTAEQISLCERYGISITKTDRLSPKIFHAKTAACVIQTDFPAFADPQIMDAVKKHTTGARRMSLFAKLLYLADYIEETRTFADCIALRHMFWDSVGALSPQERILHLNRVLLHSYDLTISALLAEGAVVAPDTIDARNALVEEFNKHIAHGKSKTNKNN